MTDRPSPAESRLTGLVLVAMTALAALSIDITLPSLPATQRSFSTDVATAQLTLSVFFIGFACGQLVVGPLSDRFGRRPIVLGGLVGFAITSIVCALAPSIETLIAARFVQALCACAGPVLGRAIVRDLYGPERAARMLANMMTVFAFMPAAAPMVGGLIDATLGWRWSYGLIAFYGGCLVITVFWRLGETNRMLNPRALVPRHLAKNYGALLASRTFLSYALGNAFASGGLLAYISGSSFVMIEAFGVKPAEFGVFFGSIAIGVIIGSRVSAGMTGRRGIPATIRFGARFLVAGGLAMSVIALSGFPAPGYGAAVAVALSQICYMVGLGIVMPAGTAGAIAPYPQMAGTASALVGFAQMGSGAITGAVAARLFDQTALPMALLILGCAFASAAAGRLAPPPATPIRP